MEPVDTTNTDSNVTGDVGSSRPSRPSKRKVPKLSGKALKGARGVIRKFWYVFAVLLVIIIAFATWRVLALNTDAAWEAATGHYAKAEYKEAEEIIRDFPVPGDQERQRIYAQTMQATGNIDKALAGYEKLYESTNDVSAKIAIGNIYNQKKEYDKAIDAYREVIQSNKNNIQAYVNMATVYRLQGKKDEAIKVAKEAVDNNPNNATLLELHVSMLMDDKKSPEYKKAIDALKKVNPDDPLLEALEQ